MATDAMTQAIGRLSKAVSRAETLARTLEEERAQQIEAQIAASMGADGDESAKTPAVDIDPFSRDKAIAALKSLDALIGDLQKARSEA